MQGGLVRRKLIHPSVRQSVCLSVKRVNCDKKEERSFKISRSFSLAILEEIKIGLLPEILDTPAPVLTKSPILNRCSLVAPQP